MQQRPVKSDLIRSVGYDAGSKTLSLVFKDGDEYHYADVPEVVHRELLLADSTGAHFHRHIRNRYKMRKIAQED